MPDGLSPKMAPARRDGESEVLKDAGWVLAGKSLGWSRFWENLEGRDSVLSRWNVV